MAAAAPGVDARVRAARVLADVLARRTSLPDAFARHGRGADDPALVRELAWGTARHGLRLDEIVRARLKRPPKSRDLDVHALMMIGAYQLGWTSIPDHAGVHATVAATEALGKRWARGLVNAVLRRLASTDPADDSGLSQAARTDHPDWLRTALARAWPEDVDAVIAAGNARPPMTLRARDGAEAGVARLADEGIEAHAGAVSPDAVYLAEPMPVEALPGFAEGAFSVQDEGAQLAAALLAPRPGERVLDACAAPGGKTLHLAQRAPEAELVALDVEPRRLERVRENLVRGGARARLEALDATDAGTLATLGDFDRVLIDAPCTATGILRRQPDVRLLREPGDGARLAAVQRALLEAIWPRLRGGGTLVFCTCSVLPEEGEMVVRAFADAHPDAVIDPIDASWGRPAGPGRQLLPTIDAHDGFFYARLRRDA